MQDVLQSAGQVGSAPGSGHTTWIQTVPVGLVGGRLMESTAETAALNPKIQLTIRKGRCMAVDMRSK